jgi:T4 bacteriophage base plate protein
MALPKIDVPTYEIVLPVSKKKLKYRPFLVKEQRNLLMAMESSDSSTIQQSVKDILHNCTLTEGIDIEKLPIIDVEYYFINLRAKSVGEIVESRYKCNNEVDGEECGNIMESEINLLDIKVESNNEISPEIQLDSKLTIKLKYPEFSIVEDSLKYDNINEVTFNMIAQSIEYIYDGEQFYYASESTPKELLDFVEGMNQEQFAKVEEFFNNLPKLKETLDITCKKCGYEHHIDVEGLESFFV